MQTNSVTRQVTFNCTKIGRKCQNSKISNAIFWVIFKQCDLRFFFCLTWQWQWHIIQTILTDSWVNKNIVCHRQYLFLLSIICSKKKVLSNPLKALFLKHTLFENYSKCRIWIFEFWHLSPIFVLSKLTSLVTLYDRKLQVFKSSPNWTIFGLSTQNVNVARFARNVEWDFFCDFQTPWRSKVVFEKLKTFCGWYSGTVSSLLSQDKSRFSCQKQFSRPFQKLFQPSSWKRTSKSWPPPLSFLLSR